MTIILIAEVEEIPVEHSKENIRLITRAFLEIVVNVPTKLEDDGYSDYQRRMLAMTFVRILENGNDVENPLWEYVKEIENKIKEAKLTWETAHPTYSLSWDYNNSLVLSPAIVH